MLAKNTASYNGMAYIPSCPNCEQLLHKIEEQTTLLQQDLKEINNNLKLPKLGKTENEALTTPNN